MIKKTFKWLGMITLLLLMAASVWLINAIWFKPFNINTFFNRVTIEFALESPELLSSLRILESFGLNFHNDDLDDESPEKAIATLNKLEKHREVLRSYSDDELNEDEKLSKEIADYFLTLMIDSKDFQFHNYPVNQLFGVQSGFPSFMESTHQVHSVKDAENYITRLSKVGIKFSQVLEGLKLREENQILPPRFVVDRVLEEMKNFINTPIDENILQSSFVEKLSKAETIEVNQRDSLIANAKQTIEVDVYPAYQSLITYFERIYEKTDNRHGVWKLPNGDAYYRLALKLFTTTEDTPEEIHQVGLSEVDRIQDNMLEILKGEGISVENGFTQAMEELQQDTQYFYPDTDEGRQQILTDYQVMIDEITQSMPEAFHSLPKASVEVKRIPEFKEKTAPGAYYNRPALDGSRPGIFYANLYDIKATPKYGMRTLAYHEAVPGHHFQIASAMELNDVPFFRRMVPATAYIEGWALYAEYLAWEMGFQDNPMDNLGRLQAELFRAVRLVVDTGIHYKRWTREEAIKYMRNNTGMAESDVISEIERYIVMPGQACSYKIGMSKILALREMAKQKLGNQFDIRDFHDVILKNGAMPLAVLEKVVNDYVENGVKAGTS
ncbi:MAG: DUF885 domain-containing protein [Pseudomonadota bacterium]